MKRVVLVLCVLLLAAPLFASHRGLSTHSRGEVRDCNDVEMTIDDRDTVRTVQEARYAGSTPLHVITPDRGGLHVFGYTGSEFAVKACIGALSQELLGQVHINYANGQLTAQGPSGDDWAVVLIVQAPANATMQLEARNGPISARDLAGTVDIRVTNGPVAMEHCTGRMNVKASNGPVSYSGGGGKLDLNTQNGPIHIALEGMQWNGEGLTAHAENGPLSLSLPSGYQTGVRVETSNHAPFHCGAAACAQARRDWNDEHKAVEFGNGPIALRLSTENGPISIDREGHDE
jgi:hypothetical protein